MEQRDYLLREIEKIGAILRYIRQKLFGGKGNEAISLEQQFDNEKVSLLTEVNFDIDRFFALDREASNEYLSAFVGFDAGNIELLADCLYQAGKEGESENSKKYLEKALQLYELCNLKSNTYSIGREKIIKTIREAIETS